MRCTMSYPLRCGNNLMVLSKYFTAPIFPGCLDNVMLRRVSIHLPPSDTTVTLCPISRSAAARLAWKLLASPMRSIFNCCCIGTLVFCRQNYSKCRCRPAIIHYFCDVTQYCPSTTCLCDIRLITLR